MDCSYLPFFSLHGFYDVRALFYSEIMDRNCQEVMDGTDIIALQPTQKKTLAGIFSQHACTFKEKEQFFAISHTRHKLFEKHNSAMSCAGINSFSCMHLNCLERIVN
jgi:hypothetical protein